MVETQRHHEQPVWHVIFADLVRVAFLRRLTGATLNSRAGAVGSPPERKICSPSADGLPKNPSSVTQEAPSLCAITDGWNVTHPVSMLVQRQQSRYRPRR